MMLQNSNTKRGKGISERKRLTKSNSQDTGQILSRQENVGPPNGMRMGEGFRCAKELILKFDGTNMSVIMFIEQCQAVVAFLEAHEIPFLLIIIRNKI